jgi:hypothetical protein
MLSASGRRHRVAAGILPAVEGGIPAARTATRRFEHASRMNSHSAGRDARLYGRQDACRYVEGRWQCSDTPDHAQHDGYKERIGRVA